MQLHWKFLEEQFDRLAQIGERVLDRFPLRGRAGFEIESDEATFFGGGQDGGGLHDISPMERTGNLACCLTQRQRSSPGSGAGPLHHPADGPPPPALPREEFILLLS